VTTVDSSDAAYRARAGVDRLIAEQVAASDPEAFETRPIFPGATSTERAPRPLSAVAAAVRVADMAAGRARELAAKARGDGATWSEVADAAGLQPDPNRSRAEAAFEWAAGPPPGGWSWSWETSVGWDCRACGRWVTDRGPYNPPPDDNESGHAADCPRHRAAVAAYEARRDDTDGM